MFQGEHSDRCRAKGDEVEDGGGERVELHAAGVRGLSWWLEWNEKEAGQYRHLAHMCTIEMLYGTVTFIRAQRSLCSKSERIPLTHALVWYPEWCLAASLQPTKPFECQSNYSQPNPLATWWLVCMRVWVCWCLRLCIRERAGGERSRDVVQCPAEQIIMNMRASDSSEGTDFSLFVHAKLVLSLTRPCSLLSFTNAPFPPPSGNWVN